MEYIVLAFVCLIVALVLVLFVIRSVRLRRRRARRRKQLQQLRQQQQELAAKERHHLECQQRRGLLPAEPSQETAQDAGTASVMEELVRIYDCAVPKVVNAVPSPQVGTISLTGEEAVRMGFAFRKKSKAVRITNYHGSAVQLVLPSAIDGLPVNEIAARAFADNQVLRRVEIPASVHKIGAEAFHASGIEYCAIAAKVDTLPDAMFEKCLRLSEVRLPETLVHIGVSTFGECQSLHHIAFPAKLRRVDDHAFRGSGLSGFTVTPQTSLTNGAAFVHTPLHNNYQFVLSRCSDTEAHVLLCGSHADGTLVFPETVHVRVHRGAMEFCPARKFDLSQCASAAVSPEAFFRHVVNDGFVTQEKYAEVILPRRAEPTCFPSSITATVPDSTPFRQYALQKEWWGEGQVIHNAAVSRLASYGIRGDMTGMTLVPASKRPFTAEYHAFVTPELVSLKAPLSPRCEELFSIRCANLQRVQFTEDGKTITKYIPDRRLIGRLHEELLGAFRGDGRHFFDRSVYDSAFRRGTCTWTDGSTRPMTQKQRLMMCFDVLRSTQRAHEEPPLPYVAYLVAHLRYARKLCKKIAPTHPEYLRWLAEQNPTEWYMMLETAQKKAELAIVS